MTLQQENEYVSIHPEVTEFSCIKNYNEDIVQSTILLNKLLGLLNEDKLTPEAFSKIASKYKGKLESNIKFREVYHETIMNESKVVDLEFDSLVAKKELLLVKKNINDIEEEEFSIKSKAIEWDLDVLNKRKLILSEGMNLLKSLSDMLNPDDMSNIARFVNDEIKSLKLAGVDQETYLEYVSSFGKVLENIP